MVAKTGLVGRYRLSALNLGLGLDFGGRAGAILMLGLADYGYLWPAWPSAQRRLIDEAGITPLEAMLYFSPRGQSLQSGPAITLRGRLTRRLVDVDAAMTVGAGLSWNWGWVHPSIELNYNEAWGSYRGVSLDARLACGRWFQFGPN